MEAVHRFRDENSTCHTLLSGSEERMSTSEPSRVIHMRNLPEECNEMDIRSLCSQYGNVDRVLHLSRQHQAFVEFTSFDESRVMLESIAARPIRLGTRVLGAQYSNKQSITFNEGGGGEHQQPKEKPPRPFPPGTDGRILLVTVSNLVYPITVDIMAKVFQPSGRVLKIATFTKMGKTQALVEFERGEDAAGALQRLHGENIYSGCNKLSIQWSNLSEMSVKVNNERTWDFEAMEDSLPPSSPVDAFASGAHQHASGLVHSVAVRSPVVLVNHLDEEKATIDALFNLFSLAGLVSRIKILYNNRESALVQFETPEHAANARTCLSGCPLWGKFILVSPSKHVFVQANKSDLEPSKDGGPPLFGDFATSRHHRYRGAAARNVPVIEPSKLLHVSSIAAESSELDVAAVFAPYGEVSRVKFIRGGNQGGGQQQGGEGGVVSGGGKKMALVCMGGVSQAAEAICGVHTQSLHGSRLRVSFSLSSMDGR